MRSKLLFAVFVAVVSTATVSPAQDDPPLVLEDHFQTYRLEFPWDVFELLTLRDQFSSYDIAGEHLEKLANPAQKNEEPIIDPNRHQTWWRINADQGFTRTVFVSHQFGSFKLTVREPRYLVLPANKFLTEPANGGELPVANHYLCYEADGDTLNIPAVIQDQFGTATIFIKQPRYFCNPVEKTHGGQFFPIIDFDAHLTCYDIETGLPPIGADVWLQDQLHFTGNQALEPCWFCIPSSKDGVVGTEESTWGRIKSLYNR